MDLAVRFCTSFAVVFAAAVFLLVGVAHADTYWPEAGGPAVAADVQGSSADATAGDDAAPAAASAPAADRWAAADPQAADPQAADPVATAAAAGQVIRVRARRTGVVVVTVTCGVGTQFRCGGHVTLRAADRLRAGGRTYARNAPLATSEYGIAGGAHGAVSLTLSPALASLAKAGRISTLGVQIDGDGGQRVTLPLQR